MTCGGCCRFLFTFCAELKYLLFVNINISSVKIRVVAGYILVELCGEEFEYLDLRNRKCQEDRGNCVITIFTKLCLNDLVNESKMGGLSSPHGRSEKCAWNLSEMLKGRENFGTSCVTTGRVL